MLKWTLKCNANQSITCPFTPLSLTLSSKLFFLTSFITVPLARSWPPLLPASTTFLSSSRYSPLALSRHCSVRESWHLFSPHHLPQRTSLLSCCHSNLYFSLLLVPLRECMCYSGLFMEGNIRTVTITFRF